MSSTLSQHSPTDATKRPQAGADRNKAIQGLRGLSAFCVILAHIDELSEHYGLIRASGNAVLAAAMPRLGTFSVVTFFFISGYLIVQSLVKHGNVRVFLQNRVARIYPVFIILQVILYALSRFGGYAYLRDLTRTPAALAQSFLANALFLPGIFKFPIAQKNAWSLSYEWAFYLCASLCFLSVATYRSRKALAIPYIAVSVAAIVALLVTRPMMGFFLVGVGAWYWIDRRGGKVPSFISVGPVSILAFVAAYVGYLFKIMPLCYLFGAIFFVSVVCERGWLSSILATRPMQYLGMISYSLYLIHPFALGPILIVLRHFARHIHNPTMFVGVFAVVGIPLAIFFGSVSYELIEVRLTRKLFPRRKTSTPPPSIVAAVEES